LAIAEALVNDLNRKHQTRVTGISAEVAEIFEIHDWPGNIRELRNVLERAVILTGQGEIPVKNLPIHIQKMKPEGLQGAEKLPSSAAMVAAAAAAGGAGGMLESASVAEAVLDADPEPSAEEIVDVVPEVNGTEPKSELLQLSIGTTVEAAEKALILRTLEHTRNNKTRAAEVLGISLKTLHNKLKEYGTRDAI
jgi:DNA-binding NtrC family response regulator